MVSDDNSTALNTIRDLHEETLDCIIKMIDAVNFPTRHFTAKEIAVRASRMNLLLNPREICSALYSIDVVRRADWRWDIDSALSQISLYRARLTAAISQPRL